MNKNRIIELLDEKNWKIKGDLYDEIMELIVDFKFRGWSFNRGKDWIMKYGSDEEKKLFNEVKIDDIIDEIVVRGLLDGWVVDDFKG